MVGWNHCKLLALGIFEIVQIIYQQLFETIIIYKSLSLNRNGYLKPYNCLKKEIMFIMILNFIRSWNIDITIQYKVSLTRPVIQQALQYSQSSLPFLFPSRYISFAFLNTNIATVKSRNVYSQERITYFSKGFFNVIILYILAGFFACFTPEYCSWVYFYFYCYKLLLIQHV